MPDIYNRPRNYIQEAEASLVEYERAGHTLYTSGQGYRLCTKDCPICTKNFINFQQAYALVIKYIEKKLAGPPRLHKYEGSITVSRQTLHALAHHPATGTINPGERLSLVVTVPVEHKTAKILVRSHAPLQCLPEPYTPETLPDPLPWSEGTSEGILPDLNHIKELKEK